MKLSSLFDSLGQSVVQHPCIYITACISILCIASIGITNVVFEDDPQELWVNFKGRGYAEQADFNKDFGAYYRINQLIYRPVDESVYVDIFQKNYLMRLLAIENAIESRKIEVNNQLFNISDFCYAPIPEKGCVVESPLEYWRLQYDMLKNDTDVKYTTTCIKNNFEDGLPCSSRAGYPVLPNVVFGGTSCIGQDSPTFNKVCSACYYQAQALFINYLFLNNDFTQNIAMDWEKNIFEDVINAVNNGSFVYTDYGVTEEDINGTVPLKITYMAQRSISDEIVAEAGSNAFIVVLSYLLMFLYVAVAIGSFPNKVHSSFLLGFGGILIVIASVASSIGFTSLIGYGVSLISAEVVPFLILAIGVDNMFIIANAFSRLQHESNLSIRMGMTLREVGPSITAAAFCEFLAFFVGATTDIPALQSFCLTASVAVLFDYVFQMLVFVALLSIDEKRKQAGRWDVFFCLRAKTVDPPKYDRVRSLLDKYYIPVLFSIPCQIFAIVGFFGLIALSIVGYQNLGLGLEQEISFDQNSGIYSYFLDQMKYGEVGPQGYVVLTGVDFSDSDDLGVISEMNDAMSRLSCCIDPPVYSWFPQFNTSIDGSTIDFPGRADACNAVERSQLATVDAKIESFLQIKTTDICCAKYGVCGEQFASDFVFDTFGNIVATRLRFNHVALSTQEAFINSFVQTRSLVDQYSKQFKNGASAYAYSMYYVYFEQYTYIKGVALTNLLLATAIVYSAILVLKNAAAGLFVFISVLFTTVDILGLIYLSNVIVPGFQVQINAVSVVNLITAVGLSVEFCVHIILKFTNTPGTRLERAKIAVSEMGSSVIVGITITKFLGVLVLAFAPTPLFRMYYFRMYLCIVILGSFHGLIFLPVVLRWIGPQHSNKKKNSSVLEPAPEAVYKAVPTENPVEAPVEAPTGTVTGTGTVEATGTTN